MEKLNLRLKEFGLTEAEILECLHALAERLEFKRGTKLNKPGRPHDRVYFIESGLIKITDYTDEIALICWLLSENHLVTAPDSFISGKPTRYEIEALENLVVLSITKEQLYSVGRTHCKLFETVDAINDKYRADRDIQVNDFKKWDPQQRFHWFMKYHGDLYLRVSNRDLANYLWMDEKTLWECKTGIYRKGKGRNKQ